MLFGIWTLPNSNFLWLLVVRIPEVPILGFNRELWVERLHVVDSRRVEVSRVMRRVIAGILQRACVCDRRLDLLQHFLLFGGQFAFDYCWRCPVPSSAAARFFIGIDDRRR